MNKVLQWNIKGCIYHYCELKQLLSSFNPVCVCLQETHFKPGQPYSLRNYSIVRKDMEPNVRVRGGVGIILRNDAHFQQLHVISNLQVVAVRMSFPLDLTVCNFYLPEAGWNTSDIAAIVSQLPKPFILLGDFNAHNPLWGSDHRDQRGKMVEHLLESPELVLLNDGSPTYFNARSRGFSRIDLTIVSASLATRFTWKALDDLHGSDHFPIVINTDTPSTVRVLPSRWLTYKANWPAFDTALQTPSASENTLEDVRNMTDELLTAASVCIPSTRPTVFKQRVPW